MQKYILKTITLIALTLTLSVSSVEVNAQCPMCRMAVESNLENGGSAGKGLNKGILYLLATPYLLIGTIGIFWYRNRKKDEDDIITTFDKKE